MSGLIVQAQTDNSSSGGIIDDVTSLVTDYQNKSEDGLDHGIDIGTVALDVLGLITDPLGGAFSAGIGWIIEHIGFLRDPFDALLGNPAEITAIASTWMNIGLSLKQTAESVGTEVGSVSSWQGEAADAYRKAAQTYQSALMAGSVGAAAISGLTTAAGVLISAVRQWVLDTLGKFVERVVIYIVSALASSWCTFGASIEIAIDVTVVDSNMQVVSIESETYRVEAQVTIYTGKLGEIAEKVEPVLEKLSQWAERMETNKWAKGLDTFGKTQIPGAISGVNSTRDNSNAH